LHIPSSYTKLRCEYNWLYLWLYDLLTSYIGLLKGIYTTEWILLHETEISILSLLFNFYIDQVLYHAQMSLWKGGTFCTTM
jgi:hypothetical protein